MPRTPSRRLAGLATAVAVAATALAAPLAVVTAGPAAAGPEVRRIAGTDRYSTAVAVSRATHPTGAPVALLTTGSTFPDALAGGPAASKLGGPVLLVAPDSIPTVVLDELRRLSPQRVLLLGGTGAVSDAALDQLTEAGYRVERIAGEGRYETAALTSRAAFAIGTPTVYVATGADYPDALAGAAAAAAVGAPVLLVAPDDLPSATAIELRRLAPQRIVVLGGPSAVSAEVERELALYAPTITRIAGSDRFDTSAAVSRATPGRPPAIFLATGTGFADALAGGPAAAAAKAPVLLVRQSCIPGSVHVEMERHSYPPLTLLGGTAVLGRDIAELHPCFRVPDGEIAPGISVSTIADPRGPWSGKVVAVAPSALWRLRTVLGQDALPGLETTSSIARRSGAIAAINGDFALAGGRPVHAFAKAGRLVQTAQTAGRNVAVESRANLPKLGSAKVAVTLDVPDAGLLAPVTVVNSGPSGREGVALRTTQGGSIAPVPGNSCAARVQQTRSPFLDDAGRTTQVYSVSEVRCGSSPMTGTGDVLTAPLDGTYAPLIEGLAVGEQVEVSYTFGWQDVLESLGGNPTLLEGGAMTADVNGTDEFSKRNPRTAVGYRPDGTVLLVTVDGRGADASVGMSLRELADLFVRLGASDALNLDGGGSTTMVIGGELQNRPSDGPERAVSSALILIPGTQPAEGMRSSTATPLEPAEPLSPQEQEQAERALLSDPGSTGGLFAHLDGR